MSDAASDRPTVCVVGSGGREHVLAAVLARSARVVVTPGNPGMTNPTAAGGPGAEEWITTTAAPAGEIDADLFVIGPEAPLVAGLADELRAAGRAVVGPGRDGARLEGSKAFMKQVLAEAGVPTARFGVFGDAGEARRFLGSLEPPFVVKTDGLAAGKGVLVTASIDEAEADVVAKLSGVSFGDAGRTVVIEEGLAGRECSVLALCDGERVATLRPARDFKRVDDGDGGPNTGGMGAYSPLPDVDDEMLGRITDQAIEPLVATLRRRGIDYRGVLYAGLMIGPDGPKVLEFNVRFGDPEAQVVLPRLSSDLAGLLAEVATGRLRSEPTVASDAAVCVVMAAEGYPARVRNGDVIEGIADAASVPGVSVFHAGTRSDDQGRLVTAGGRVLGVTATGPSRDEARRRAYEAVGRIHWQGEHHRADIALDDPLAHAGPAPTARSAS